MVFFSLPIGAMLARGWLDESAPEGGTMAPLTDDDGTLPRDDMVEPQRASGEEDATGATDEDHSGEGEPGSEVLFDNVLIGDYQRTLDEDPDGKTDERLRRVIEDDSQDGAAHADQLYVQLGHGQDLQRADIADQAAAESMRSDKLDSQDSQGSKDQALFQVLNTGALGFPPAKLPKVTGDTGIGPTDDGRTLSRADIAEPGEGMATASAWSATSSGQDSPKTDVETGGDEIVPAPAATLLLPYFEVDSDAGRGEGDTRGESVVAQHDQGDRADPGKRRWSGRLIALVVVGLLVLGGTAFAVVGAGGSTSHVRVPTTVAGTAPLEATQPVPSTALSPDAAEATTPRVTTVARTTARTSTGVTARRRAAPTTVVAPNAKSPATTPNPATTTPVTSPPPSTTPRP